MAAVARAQEDSEAPSGRGVDVWGDAEVMEYARTGQLPAGQAADAEWRALSSRIRRRARRYRWQGDTLVRVMEDGSSRQVPAPQLRGELVRKAHEKTGHCGGRRTLSLLSHCFWWYGMARDVRAAVAACALCARVRASFNAQSPTLQSLPICGLMYRWGVDTVGPFPRTPAGNRYVLVMIEHFSKHAELAPMPDKLSAHTRGAFLECVLARFGAPAEVVTDQGGEFQDSFHDLLVSCLIDHRVTSPNHPQANGLAERCVQSIKRALRKCCEARGGERTAWDADLPWIALGYRCSVQAATGFTPYELLYGRKPVIPPAVAERAAGPIDFDSPEAAAASLERRAAWFRKHVPIAAANLEVAQHRDALWYAHLRGGGYLPRLRKFEPGDFVWLRYRNKQSTLQPLARPEILRVVEVREGGAVTLQGKCGSTINNNISNCAPCHLPVDPSIDHKLARPALTHACEACRFPDEARSMLLCDNCGGGWHMGCLEPALEDVPEGVWLCPHCTDAGVLASEVEAVLDNQQRQRREQEERLRQEPREAGTGAGHEPTPPARQRAGRRAGRARNQRQQGGASSPPPRQRRPRTAAEATAGPGREPAGVNLGESQLAQLRALEGRLVVKKFDNPATGRQKRYWGKITVVGTGRTAFPVLVTYEDGDSETMEVEEVKPFLMPVGTPLPRGVVIPPPGVAAAAEGAVGEPPAVGLPDRWDLHTVAGVEQAMQQLMPGAWPRGALEAVAACVRSPPVVPGPHNEQQAEAQANMLGEALQFAAVLSAVEIYPAAGGLPSGAVRALRVAGVKVARLPWRASPLEARTWRQCVGPLDVVVGAPPAPLLDVLLPLVLRFVGVAVVVPAPREYITAAPYPRRRWLQGLQAQGRLMLLQDPPLVSPGLKEFVWVLAFSTRAARQLMETWPDLALARQRGKRKESKGDGVSDM